MKSPKLFLSVLIFFILGTYFVSADEGMWPITEIDRLNLKKKGLKLEVQDIFNPGGVSLVHAIVHLGGCTASFVSADGLILTNHHCAFRGVQMASTEENDYLTNGFLARDHSEEIPARGYTASIVELYRDVSDQVLSAVSDTMDAATRTKAIEKRTKEIIVEAEKEFPGKRAEISEMFLGKTYYLFIYTYLRDIRLVYVPPRGIGGFGGETDNWMWPRHTGDFSFVRAYVAPDGTPADYAPENIPYNPVTHFKVEPRGVNEEDFLFILGFPGRTYRHRSSYYMSYENDIRLPTMADWYEWQINLLTDFSKEDHGVALRVSSAIKGLSNRMKNYRGKLTGIKKLNLIEARQKSEQKLQEYIEQDSERKQKYGTILSSIKELYENKRQHANREFVLDELTRASMLLSNARTVIRAAENRVKPDIERESAYMDRNFARTRQRVLQRIDNYHPQSEKIILKQVLLRANELEEGERIESLDKIFNNQSPEKMIDQFIDTLYSRSRCADKAFIKKAIEKTDDELSVLNDPALSFMKSMKAVYDADREERRRFQGELSSLHSKLLDIKQEFLAQSFIPDANSTLRLTYGYVRGYQPRDGVYYKPISFFKGVIEKTTQEEPFITPPALIELHGKKEFGIFRHPSKNDVPVCILYNTDTSGGNSGSPILNAEGRLVGVNFDRAWEATINDYAWSELYSRSIGVDIRYVLWITQKFAGADHLLNEMGVTK